jgi:hypothetical protein
MNLLAAIHVRLACIVVLGCEILLVADTGPATVAQPDGGLRLFVAPNGLKSNDGSIDKPFASLEQARDRLRQLRRSPGGLPAGAIVYLRGGAYQRDGSFDLKQEDSGTPACPIRYAGYPNEIVRIVGGKRLDPSWFVAVGQQSPAWPQINAAARGNLMQVDLAAHGIFDLGKGVPRAGWGWNGRSGLELFFNSKPMEMGRWPQEGFARIAAAPDGQKGKTFTYEGAGPERWQTKDIWVGGLLGTYWFYSLSSATVDVQMKTITLAQGPAYGLKKDHPFVVWNVLEEIARPGQWALDHKVKILYFWPPDKLDKGDIFVSTLDDVPLKLNNVSHVTFQDMTIEIARGGLVKIDGGSGNRLMNCVLRNAGTFGADISGSDNGLDGCQVYDVGERGVILSGGDRPTLRPAGNFVRNTEIHHWGRIVRTSKVAIHLEGVGQIVSHCLLHDAPHGAIWYYGNNHLIEYTDIHHVCQETADAGAIYGGRDWGYQGIVIRNNFIHDCASVFTPGDIYGVYMDDAVSAATVEGNIFYRIAGTATFNAGGRDNKYRNNLFVKCAIAHLADRRGMDIITDKRGHACNFLERLNKAAGGDYQKSPWAEAYPALAKIPNDYQQMSQGGFKNPGGCVFSRNLGFANKRWTKEGSWGGFLQAFDYYQEVEGNVPDSDPLFVNESAGDLNLRPESPALRIKGWRSIPFDEIGLQRKK